MVAAMDQAEEQKARKREKEADLAASAAFAKVETALPKEGAAPTSTGEAV